MRQRKITVRKYSDSKRRHLKFVVNYREAGNRKRTFFETKEEATDFARLKNEELKRTGIKGASLPTKLRVEAKECAEQLRAYGKTIADATRFFVQHLKASEKSCTAAQLVAELLIAKKADGASQPHLADLRSRLGKFAKAFDVQTIATITGAQIDDWLRSLGGAPATRNHYRRLLVLMFKFAMRRGYATANPAENTEKAKERHDRPGILKIAEAARLLESVTPAVLPYVAIGLFAGLRRAELERQDWSGVDFESGLIEVTAENSKTARARFVTIQPVLREWLLPLRKHRGHVVPEANFRKLFEEAREAAGIAEWPDNALRHSFASYHLAHFKDAKSLALEMGHMNSGTTFAHYRQLVRPNEAARYWNIRPAKTEKIVPIVAHV
ncbi:MAG: tyrosine-type recombinase/integrase [Chthoniobacterales bacterium]|nr:tyrosine-type recombinase/integrase [Chthoniobacterales bacterium]